MSMGAPGDHPISDMLNHGMNPFPTDMAAMIRRLHAKHWTLTDAISLDAYRWEKGEALEEGRKKLRQLCAANGV